MSYCEACAIRAGIGDLSSATVGATGSVKRLSRRRWVWHVHSLATHFNDGAGYTVEGETKTKDAAVAAMRAVLNIAAVAWETGEKDGLGFAMEAAR